VTQAEFLTFPIAPKRAIPHIAMGFNPSELFFGKTAPNFRRFQKQLIRYFLTQTKTCPQRTLIKEICPQITQMMIKIICVYLRNLRTVILRLRKQDVTEI
jgi:hypothetical protein